MESQASIGRAARGRLGLPDQGLLLAVFTLLGVGLVMIYSASAVRAATVYGQEFYFAIRQAIWASLGLVGMWMFSRLDHRFFYRLAGPAAFAAVALLVAVLIPGVGKEVGGATRWIGFGPLQFQPSEFAKIALVLYYARWFADRRSHRTDSASFKRDLLGPLALLVVVFGLIMAEPDMGTALTIAGTALAMFFAAGLPVGYLLGLGAAAVPGVVYLAVFEKYRLNRVLAFLDPFNPAYRDNIAYHTVQSLYAIGSGGIFGVGIGQSRQKLFYLPAEHTDSIFSVIGEELGFVGASAVVLLFLFFAWRGYRIALAAPSAFSSLFAAGITSLIVVQVAINLGVVTASLPFTGIPLPLISFGGSSLVFTLAGIGILLNISRSASRLP